jgi:capsular polysaccharide transport system permease protein
VRLLRKRGIDPFQRSSMLELVGGQPDPKAALAEPGRVQLPQAVRQPANLPGPVVMDDSRRIAEIARMQADIMRRRRRKSMMLLARLAAFVLLPTLIVSYYFYFVASPLYATRSEFVIQQAEPQGMSGAGSLLRGTTFATSQDAITVQSYLQSRDAMLRLDHDLGFKAHFSAPTVDALQQLDPKATNEAAYKLYKRNVKIAFDPTEGIIKMEVIALDPKVSEQFNRALIRYAEEQVDQLTSRLRADQMKGSSESYKDAETKVTDAQQRVLDLQQQMGVLDPLLESNAVMAQISGLEVQAQQKQLALQQLLDNAQPNKARVDGVKGDIARINEAIAGLRAQLTQGTSNSASLAAISGRLRIAEADLETRQLMLSTSLQSLETSRIEANRQVRYLSLGVAPMAPDEATYPRKFENSILAFLVFSGIYLMLSLTASILREQVTA